MATESVTTESLFRSRGGGYLMGVNAGFDAKDATMEASALEEAVRALLGKAVVEDGMSSPIAHLCEFALEAAAALRDAAYQEA